MQISGQLIPTIRQLNAWPRFRLRLLSASLPALQPGSFGGS